VISPGAAQRRARGLRPAADVTPPGGRWPGRWPGASVPDIGMPGTVSGRGPKRAWTRPPVTPQSSGRRRGPGTGRELASVQSGDAGEHQGQQDHRSQADQADPTGTRTSVEHRAPGSPGHQLAPTAAARPATSPPPQRPTETAALCGTCRAPTVGRRPGSAVSGAGGHDLVDAVGAGAGEGVGTGEVVGPGVQLGGAAQHHRERGSIGGGGECPLLLPGGEIPGHTSDGDLGAGAVDGVGLTVGGEEGGVRPRLTAVVGVPRSRLAYGQPSIRTGRPCGARCRRGGPRSRR
jgi:hypothetical protein